MHALESKFHCKRRFVYKSINFIKKRLFDHDDVAKDDTSLACTVSHPTNWFSSSCISSPALRGTCANCTLSWYRQNCRLGRLIECQRIKSFPYQRELNLLCVFFFCLLHFTSRFDHQRQPRWDETWMAHTKKENDFHRSRKSP